MTASFCSFSYHPNTISLLMLLANILSVSPAFAIVDMKNANYSQSWVDLEVPGYGYLMKINRTYNSRSTHNGIFGFGWCSDYETSLSITAEGNIKIIHCGAGQESLYIRPDFKRQDVDKTVNSILDAVIKEKNPSSDDLLGFKKDLYLYESLRSRFAAAYQISAPKPRESDIFMENGKGIRIITYKNGFYTMDAEDGSSTLFSSDGRVSYFYDKNRNYIHLMYDGDQLIEIVDENGRKLKFRYFPNNKVRSIVGPDGIVAKYRYYVDDLVWSESASKHLEYRYEYDDAHNLTKVTYPEGQYLALTYDKKNDWVTSFTHLDGCKESYVYEFDRESENTHFWSKVVKICKEKVVTNAKHEFWYSIRKDGSKYLSRIRAIVNDDDTDITYEEVFGLPIIIRRGSNVSTFEYFSDGQLKQKRSDRMTQSFLYDNNVSKIAEIFSVRRNASDEVVSTSKTILKYAENGNLTGFETSDGKLIEFIYDYKGKITHIKNASGNGIDIGYDEKTGLPVTLDWRSVGLFNVTYSNTVDIKGVTTEIEVKKIVDFAREFNEILDVASIPIKHPDYLFTDNTVMADQCVLANNPFRPLQVIRFWLWPANTEEDIIKQRLSAISKDNHVKRIK